jgi:tetratricopeptide (TPR) repeat protein
MRLVLRIGTSIAILLAFMPACLAQMEQHDHHAEGVERLGTVVFQTSCTPAAQAKFTRAVALLHSFWYEEAEKAFTEAANADPQCGMAWWGVAMSNYHPVWPSPYSPAELARGVAAAKKAKAAGAKTAREQGYIDAIVAFYDDIEHRDLNTRARAYEAGMQRVTAANPADDEAAIFYGLSLIAHGMSQPTDKTYAYQKQAAEIFNRLLATHPDHPGIAHYLIHSFDYPALAPLALNAAYAYAKIAPSSPHALHMPSHIFVRLGMWPETIESNLKSSNAAREHAAHAHPGAVSFDNLHASDYLAYAYLQLGQDEPVRQLAEDLAAIKSLDVENFAAYYAMASVPARYALERKRWSDAASLTVRPANLPWDRYAYAEAVTYFASGMGKARGGNPAGAHADVDQLNRLRQLLLDQKNAYWADQVEVQILAVDGWTAHAEGRKDAAEAALRKAADLEDSMDKSPVTPGSILPAREMLGDFLLATNRPQEALDAYERSLKASPSRLNGLSGAAHAAQLAGDRDKARTYYTQVAKLLATNTR